MDLINIIVGALLLCYSVTTGHTIKNGYATTIENYPYQVSLEVDEIPTCGGAILGDQWVLTTNSCLPADLTEVSRVRVRAGSSILGAGGALHTVSKMVRYNYGSYFHSSNLDIALVKLDVAFVYSDNIQWSRPAIEYLTESDSITIAGWGLQGSGVSSFGLSLQTANVQMISSESCTQKYQGKLEIGDSMVCLEAKSSSDNACIGDVGTPIAVNGLVAGVIANNEFCWDEGLPLVVTDIGNAGLFLIFTLAEPVIRK